MTSRAKDVRLARAGAPLGLALAALAVSGWTLPAGNPPDGVAATLTAAPTGELGVVPAGRIAQGRDLKAGDELAGRFVLTNQTGSPRAVALRAATPRHDLDARMDLNATVGGRTVTDGSLAAARRWSRRVVLGAGERRHVKVRLSVPPGARGYDEREADVRIELRSEPVR